MERYFLQASIPADFHESTQVALWTMQKFKGWASSVQILAYGSATTLALLSNIIIGKHQEGNSEHHQGHSKDVFFLKSGLCSAHKLPQMYSCYINNFPSVLSFSLEAQ